MRGAARTLGRRQHADFGRPRHSTGTVVRIESAHVVVSCCSPCGIRYVQRYSRRDGARAGGGHRAELVNRESPMPVTAEQRRQELRIEAAYRAWARNRADVDRLRELHAATSEALSTSLVQTQ